MKTVLVSSLAALSAFGCDQPNTDLGDRVTESESDSGSGGMSSSTGGETSNGSGDTSSSSGELPQETGDSTGPPPVGECAPLTTEASYADECLAEFCLEGSTFEQPTGDAIFGCSIFGCDEGPGGEIGFQLTQGDTSVALFFEPEILDGYSTAAFNETFTRIAGQIDIPGIDGSITTFVSDEVPALVYEDGLLQFTLTLEPDSVFYVIESNAKDCLSDDIQGECPCSYGSLGEMQVSFSAPVEEI